MRGRLIGPLTLITWAGLMHAAGAQDLRVAIDSASTFDLHAIYAAPAGTAGWRAAALQGTAPQGPEVPAGGAGEFVLSSSQPVCVYDLKFEMDSDVTFHDFAVNLCGQGAYTLEDLFE